MPTSTGADPGRSRDPVKACLRIVRDLQYCRDISCGAGVSPALFRTAVFSGGGGQAQFSAEAINSSRTLIIAEK